ncbi:MAG: N-acetylmuramoyl-L-alanine amidase [Anaerolineaceae bacterium]|nr:N-acetylmuramoyl-L-alanine amidase [Anaerolineaceae bacterium]
MQVKIQNSSTNQRFKPFKAIRTVLGTAFLVASLFTLWTPANLFSGRILEDMLTTIQTDPNPSTIPTNLPGNKNRIGIVSGHWGSDTGFTCSDGLSEEKLNLRIATMVRQNLSHEGFEVDLMKEFDKNLNQYQGLAIISIHNDTCEYLGDDASGFKISPALGTKEIDKSNQLTTCMIQKYRNTTGLSFHFNEITSDMTNYHSFNETHPATPIIVMETAYMNLDRELLTQNSELIAEGITEGILCYVRNETIPLEEIVPIP